MSTYQSVLQNKIPFFSVDSNKDLSIAQLNQAVSEDDGVDVRVTKFAVVDLEDDGIPELVLWLKVNGNEDYGFEVLRYQQPTVYGYTLPVFRSGQVFSH
jgi:hypothetical protein